MISFSVEVILFVFGLVFGSFFNVVNLRYDGERMLADPKVINGRSHCPHCHAVLRWFELIPLLSFLMLGGKCRHCRRHIGWQYPIVEFLTGLIFAFVPLRLAALYVGSAGAAFIALAALWIFVFSLLLLMAVIDIRLGIVPDEITILLCIIGVIIAAVSAGATSGSMLSFFGPYAGVFGFQDSAWVNRLVGAVVGLIIFGGLWLITRGRGMGMGDVKLAVPLGFLFGWPDIAGLSMAAFIIGAVFGVGAILLSRKTMKSTVPFGPFLAVAAVLVFFAGASIAGGYFGMMGM